MAHSSSNLGAHRAICKGGYDASRNGAPGALKALNDPSQTTLSTSEGVSRHFNAKRFRALVAAWVAKNGRPFSITASKDLQACFAYLDERAILPSPATVRRCIMAMYVMGNKEIAQQLQVSLLVW
jgi:hypothetical protein